MNSRLLTQAYEYFKASYYWLLQRKDSKLAWMKFKDSVVLLVKSFYK